MEKLQGIWMLKIRIILMPNREPMWEGIRMLALLILAVLILPAIWLCLMIRWRNLDGGGLIFVESKTKNVKHRRTLGSRLNNSFARGGNRLVSVRGPRRTGAETPWRRWNAKVSTSRRRRAQSTKGR